MTDHRVGEARRAYQEGRLADSERAFAALASGEGALRADGLYGLGLIRLDQDDLEAAAEYFRAVVVTQAEHVDSWLQLGEIALRLGDLANAVSYLARALSLEPQHAAARQRLAEVLADQGRGARAGGEPQG
ncbi:MAG: tetratricopeptide repeat protein [Sporichthyaceae bacterium]|nr:tetratricopeptide repeat protein [Sporichthyaceae bacterium]